MKILSKTLTLTAILLSNAVADTAPAPPKTDLWEGWTIGVTAGYHDSKLTIDSGDGLFEELSGIALFGLSGSYTWGALGVREGNAGFRIGVQYDLAFGDYSGSAYDPILGDIEIDGSFNSSLMTRFGYSWDRLWIYGTLGLTASDHFAQEVGSDSTNVLVTGAIGLGVDYRLSEHLSLRADALVSQSGSSDVSFGGTDRSVTVDQATVRLGLAWKF